MKILLADDHDLVRETLASFLQTEKSFEIVQAGDFPGAMQKSAEEGPFDLILLDYDMPGMNGLTGLKQSLGASGGKPVALISGTADKGIAQQALAVGAAGFLPKTMAASSMINALKFMMMGEIYAPIDFMTRQEEISRNPVADKLSERELQVLNGLCRGLANKEIALELALQEVTIKMHVKNICRKLEARNRTQAAMIAKDAGIY